MRWIKLATDYYRDLAVACSPDAAEVMFTRGLALAGELETSGLIPTAMLATLTRKPTQATKTAKVLVDAGLWEKVPEGYQIVSWTEHQADLERYVERKVRDRDRKRANRAAAAAAASESAHETTGESTSASADVSADESADPLSRKNQKKNAAPAAAASRPLPPPLEILRSALEAHRLVVRWDTLSADQITEIEHLIAQHGDTALVAHALRSFQPNRPIAFAQGWIGGWRQLRPPGHLEVVPGGDPCTRPGHTGTNRRCAQCAVEDLPSYGEKQR